jgi:Subtilase family
MTWVHADSERAGRGRRSGRSLLWLGLAVVALVFALAPTAQALEPGISLTPSATRPYYACPQGPCTAIIDPPAVKIAQGYELPAGGPLLEGDGEQGGYDAQDLESAYLIPASGGEGQTIALVDAFKDPRAEQALAVYRRWNGLPPCTKANGCFKAVNQKGEERALEGPASGWMYEDDLDIEIASAACPNCHIMLVLANSGSLANLSQAVDTAARLGATEISNSYGYFERDEKEAPEESRDGCGTNHCQQFNAAYKHPGIVVTAAAGDEGYAAGVMFPATSPSVIAVGGTNLYRASDARGWSEEAWEDTGSGCSELEPKPAWQTDSGCSKRTDNDVAAVAGDKTPVSMYIEGLEPGQGEWLLEAGTSVAAPLIAGVEAHASAYTRSLGAEAFYEDPASLFDVTSGRNGTCTPGYLCKAGKGYDGPTGLGTPDGFPCVESPAKEGPPCEVRENEPF